MTDQAEALRTLARPLLRQATGPREGDPPVIVIGSGKGGVGKSVLATLCAGALAADGKRVLLVDGSQNLGNLHVLLGVRPAARLDGLLRGEVTPADLVVPVTERVWLLPADSGTEGTYALSPVDRARLHHRLCAVFDGYDAVLVDAGPGIESVVRAATLRASRLVLVATPEPAALSDVYAVVKIVNLQLPALPIGIIVNRVETAEEGDDTFGRLQLAARRFLQRGLLYLGSIPEDGAIRRLVRQPAELRASAGGAAAGAAAALYDPGAWATQELAS